MGNVDDKFRKHTKIIGAASLGLIAVFLTGCGGSDESASPAPAVGTAQTDPDNPDGGAVAPMPSAGGTMGGVTPQPGGAAVPAGGMGKFAAGQLGGKDGKAVASLPYNPRRDPFFVPWQVPPPPPNIFTEVQPLRIATYNVVTPTPPNTEVREIPNRRVSGIMSGDGVFAILESGTKDPEIVKPGMLTSDGYTVVSINADSVKLQKKEGNFIYTQVVPLSDLPTNPSAGGMGGGRLGGGMGGSMGGMGGGGPQAQGTSRGGGGGVGNAGQ